MENLVDFDLPQTSAKSLISVYGKIILAPTLVFVIFVLGFLNLIALKVEIHSLLMLGILYLIALISARHNAEFGVSVFEKNIENFKSNLKNFIMKTLFNVGETKKSSAKFETFVAEYSQNIRNDNYASSMNGIFPMMGILGTFISIAISMPNFSSSNINALEGEIAQLLGGVGTAFYVSIYGIFLAIWWIYFEKRGISKFEKIIAKYNLATRNFFWEKDEILIALTRAGLGKVDLIAHTLTHSLNNAFVAKLNALIEDKFSAFSKILDLEQNASKLAAEQVLNAQTLVHENIEIYKNSHLDFEKIIASFSRLGNEIVTIQNSFSAQNREFLNANRQSADELLKFSARLLQSLNKFDAVAQNLSQNLERMSQNESVKESFDDKEILQKLKTSLNQNIENL
ncbi:MAG: MotA/TolQ/ExbB proton channel family protein [Campylobacter sp.]